MTSRQAQEIGQIIRLLRERPCAAREIVQALVSKGQITTIKQSEAMRKRVSRHLEWLSQSELAFERHENWYWHAQTRMFKSRDYYEVSLNHSKKLIPAMERLGTDKAGGTLTITTRGYLDITDKNKLLDRQFLSGAKHHMKAYSRIDSLLSTSESIGEECEEKSSQFTAAVLDKLKKRFPRVRVLNQLYAGTERSWLTDNVPNGIRDLVRAKLSGHPLPGLDVKEHGLIKLGESVMGRGTRLFQRLEDFIQSESKSSSVEELVKLEMQSYDVKVDQRSEIVKLISKIENGEPLIGNCDLCPNIQIG